MDTKQILEAELENITDLICTFMDGTGVITENTKNTIRQSIIKVVASALEETTNRHDLDHHGLGCPINKDILSSLKEQE